MKLWTKMSYRYIAEGGTLPAWHTVIGIKRNNYLVYSAFFIIAFPIRWYLRLRDFLCYNLSTSWWETQLETAYHKGYDAGKRSTKLCQ